MFSLKGHAARRVVETLHDTLCISMVADEMKRANEHVVSLWQERWDAEKIGRMTYRFLSSVSFASTNRWFRPGFLTVFILTGYGRLCKAAFDRVASSTDRCPCCFCRPETVEHFIFDCSNYFQFRPTFFDECMHEWNELINCETRFSQFSVFIKLAFEKRELSLWSNFNLSKQFNFFFGTSFNGGPMKAVSLAVVNAEYNYG